MPKKRVQKSITLLTVAAQGIRNEEEIHFSVVTILTRDIATINWSKATLREACGLSSNEDSPSMLSARIALSNGEWLVAWGDEAESMMLYLDLNPPANDIFVKISMAEQNNHNLKDIEF